MKKWTLVVCVLLLGWSYNVMAQEDGTAVPEEAVAAPEAAESTPPAAETAEVPAPQADEPAPAPAPTPVVSAVPRFAVFLPERIDQQWYWILYTIEIQHVVQSAIEKALVDGGFDVVDVSLMNLPADGGIAQVTSMDQAVKRAAANGVDYVIVGMATADPQSESSAYGLRVTRATATVTARLVRVSDAKVLSVQETSAMMGGEAFRAAAREALKRAGADAGRKLVQAARAAVGS